MHKYGYCSFCGGEVKEMLYIFQNVPAWVCQQCGEKYLTAVVAKKIEHSIKTKEKWDKSIAVPVEVFTEGVAV